MNLKTFLFFFFVAALCSSSITQAFAQITLVQNGKSTFTIVIPTDAPSSVQDAAAELQTDIELATGAKLPLQKDSTPVSTSVISLGSTQQAQDAGISSEKMGDESFRIVTQNGNLFILGPDTPDKGWTKNNGVSNGTAHGIYTFLEDYLDVRWLMPGEIGRDVPRQSTLALQAIDRTQTPKFSWRRVTHLWDYANLTQYRNIQEWTKRQKLGGAVQLNYDHNWWRTVNGDRSNYSVDTPAVRDLYKRHPEWFAMDASGKRPYPAAHYAKFETTNQELVRWFADKAIAALKNSERPITFSLSPSDGGGRWSQSPESKALYDPSPSQLFDPEAPAGEPGMSSLVLKWYHDVAQIVAKEYPQGRLAGYIYSSYVYPPTKVDMKLPNNFTPVICGIGTYGYGLYRLDNQERWKWVMDSWAKVAPEDWYYYDLPNQLLRQQEPEIGTVNFPGNTGVITPAAPDILNTIFPQLLKNGIKGTYIYGVPSWSNAALSNYLLAKMEWDPTLNADDLQKEWLHRAYGPQAGAVMEEFYIKLNGWFRDYYQENTGLSYKLTLGMLKDIYAAHYPEMEALLLQAKAQPMSEVQKQRLQLIEDNFVVLQWRLRNAGFLPASFASPLQRSDAQINALLTKENDDFALFPGAVTSASNGWSTPKPLPWKVQLADGAQPTLAGSTSPVLGDSQFLIYAAQGGEIRITPQLVTQGAYFPAYQLKDQANKTIQAGILHIGAPIVFSAKAGSAYTLSIPSRKAVNYQLLVENAAVANGSLQDKILTLSGEPAPVHVFFTPQSTPVGIFAEENGVTIKKPYSGAAAEKIMGASNTNVRVLNALDEGWKFSPDPQNDGVTRGVLKPDFDDSTWESISALDWWQMQGFSDYHGVAWYRIKFNGKPLPKGDRARLYFGAVDGNTVVYLNGEKIIDRKLGEGFKDWDSPFSSSVTDKIVSGENTLVVQVTSKNDTTASGIFKGVAIVAGRRK